MAVAVKICGINTPDALDAVVRARADYAGFVLFPPSPRHIAPDVATRLIGQLPTGMKSVVLTVDADDALVDLIAREIQPEFIQAHGRENPARIAEIGTRSGLAVIKALPIATRADLAAADIYAPVADMLLFDAKPPEGADRPGGFGQAFDWRIMADYRASRPWLLAGGLDAGNVDEAIATSGAACVDVSSGVESQTGVKDPGLIVEFVTAVRAAPSFADAQGSEEKERP